MVALLPVPVSLSAEFSRLDEYELKAVFLFNFIKFTEWPAAEMGKRDDPFIIGVVGKDPFGAALDRVIEGEKFHDKKIVIRRFSRMEDIAAASHVLFVSASEENNLTIILKLLNHRPVLTISDIENFAERGGVITLRKEGSKIAFDVNLEAAKRAELVMQAQLLRLAKIVRAKS